MDRVTTKKSAFTHPMQVAAIAKLAKDRGITEDEATEMVRAQMTKMKVGSSAKQARRNLRKASSYAAGKEAQKLR